METANPEASDPLVVVAIGASAGGLESFKTFFRNMPTDPGLAFVLVQHLDPDHKSMMVDLLQNYTPMPVASAADGMSVEKDHVYFIPPNASLTIADGQLCVARPAPPRGHRTPVDLFFKSLAEDRGPDAVGIVLSGTGSDGSLGVRAIKEAAGATMAEASSTAKYDGMPRSAVGTGLVDWVLPVEQMPQTLLQYVGNRQRLNNKHDNGDLQAQTEAELGKVLAALRNSTGHDFKGYKESTLIRRIWRRMQVRSIDDVSAYVALLREDPDEAHYLFKDLLIGVTYFFREPAAWSALAERVLPELFLDREAAPLRMWVPGCATGEEAYTLAILLSEFMDERGIHIPTQIFATDIDAAAIDVARRGAYPHSIAADLAAERLGRYFKRTSDHHVVSERLREMCVFSTHNALKDPHHVVSERLREMCVFSTHNALKDPPFSRLDLISCRNLLIYLGPKLQERLFPVFHYALLPSRFLFLGAAEGIANASRLFSTVDKKHRIFKRRDVAQRAVADFPMVLKLRHHRSSAQRADANDGSVSSLKGIVERELLTDYAPPSVLINANHEISYFFGDTSEFLTQPGGAPDFNIVRLAPAPLRTDLRTLIYRASSSGEVATRERVDFAVDGKHQAVRIVVRPLRDQKPDEGNFLVSFEPIGDEGAPKTDGDIRDDAEDLTAQLERELAAAKEHLQSTLEELETQGEELRSSNEELLSMNEELQASNEELETAKEELQSVNEELETVNAELKTRVEDLARANSDLRNLFESTQIATIFLDADQRIQNFTPAVAETFDLVEGDQGRPIKAFTHRFQHPNLAEKLDEVLRGESASQEEVVTPDGKCFVMRMNPYRNLGGNTAGVVITFIDVTLNRRDARRQRLVAELGVKALATPGLQSVIAEAAEILRDEVGADVAEVLELEAGARRLHFIGGVGWDKERGTEAHERLAEGSQRAFTLKTDSAVLCADLTSETRFEPSDFLVGAGVRSSACLVLPSPSGQPYGLLGVYARAARAISEEDLPFMRAVANVITTALQRNELEAAEVRQREASVRSESEVQLRRAERLASIGTFAAGIAHEINNPVNNILVSAQCAQRIPDPETQAQMLERIVENARRCRPIIESVLRLAKEEESEKWLCRIVDPIRRARDLLLSREDDKAEIELHGLEDLPTVRCNPTELENAFFNLFKNAIAASGSSNQVEVHASRTANGIRIEVRDHGPGIMEEDLDRIFDPFFSRKRSKGGTGLGLSLVQTIVTSHGGKIRATNAHDGGAIFAIELPVEEED